MHYRGILLCNTCPGVQFMNMKYIIKSHRLCTSGEKKLHCLCLGFFAKNGWTILHVEYSGRSVPVCVCVC